MALLLKTHMGAAFQHTLHVQCTALLCVLLFCFFGPTHLNRHHHHLNHAHWYLHTSVPAHINGQWLIPSGSSSLTLDQFSYKDACFGGIQSKGLHTVASAARRHQTIQIIPTAHLQPCLSLVGAQAKSSSMPTTLGLHKTKELREVCMGGCGWWLVVGGCAYSDNMDSH